MTRAILIAVSCAAFAQTTAPLSFEVASIKPQRTLATVPRTTVSGSRVTISAYRMWGLIAEVYQVEPHQVVGGPDWMREDLYDIAARAPEGMTPNNAQVRQMIQSLLADRFQLRVHRETRDLPVYVLTVAKNGTKMKVSSATEHATRGLSGGSVTTLFGTHQTMSDFAANLTSAGLGRPVLDHTGLIAAYGYELKWTPDQGLAAPVDGAPPSIFTAIQEQLGLKLVPQKAPIEILVVDHLERPSAN